MIGFPLRRPLKRLAHTLHRGRRSAAPARRHRCRLVLESLEGRWVPSTVTNLNDAGAGSLRQAILDTPAGGTVDFQPGLSGTITLTSGELLIAKNLTIGGPGADVITVSGNQASRVFDIAASFPVQISGLTITNGSTIAINDNGGGILNAGTLTVQDSTLTGNSAGRGGGGIFNSGSLTVTDSTLSANSAHSLGTGGGGIDTSGTLTIANSVLSGNSETSAGAGGAIYIASGMVTVTSCTVNGNTTLIGPGGGIYSSALGQLSVNGSTFRDNSSGGTGGGAISAYTLTVTDSTLTGNTASSGTGGGIAATTVTVANSTLSGNSATAGGGVAAPNVTLTDSTLSGNSAVGGGGGAIAHGSGTLTVTGSTLSGNSAALGGALINSGMGVLSVTATITDSTLSGNSAGSGGAIYNSFGSGTGSATVTITSCTLSGNSANQGGGIYNAGGPASTTARNTILAGNTAPGSPDISGVLNSQGHNLIGDGTDGSGYDPTDLVGTSTNPIDPRLGPLQDNGGPTFTPALLPGSPAIDAGDNTNAPMWDQRGAPFRRIVNGTIDIGAFEVQARAHGRPTGQPLPNPVPVQLLGTPSGSVLGQAPDLPADPSLLPGAGVPEGPTDLPGSGPSPVPTSDGQAVDAVVLAAADPGQPGDAFGPWWESDLAPLAPSRLGGS
jgi:hypothetical protein